MFQTLSASVLPQSVYLKRRTAGKYRLIHLYYNICFLLCQQSTNGKSANDNPFKMCNMHKIKFRLQQLTFLQIFVILL